MDISGLNFQRAARPRKTRQQKLMQARSFYEQAAQLGSSMQYITVEAVEAPLEERKQLRQEFEKEVKNKFYRWLARTHGDKMIEAGLEPADVTEIRYHGITALSNKPKNFWVQSVDHIIPLRWGGSNDFDNLCLIPRKLNRLKECIEQAQLSLNPDIKSIHTLAPLIVDGQYEKIPPVPDTFRKKV